MSSIGEPHTFTLWCGRMCMVCGHVDDMYCVHVCIGVMCVGYTKQDTTHCSVAPQVIGVGTPHCSRSVYATHTHTHTYTHMHTLTISVKYLKPRSPGCPVSKSLNVLSTCLMVSANKPLPSTRSSSCPSPSPPCWPVTGVTILSGGVGAEGCDNEIGLYVAQHSLL